jgi:hypothetical protein
MALDTYAGALKAGSSPLARLSKLLRSWILLHSSGAAAADIHSRKKLQQELNSIFFTIKITYYILSIE